MEKHSILLGTLLLVLFSSFTSTEACKYAGSNIGYVKSQTEKALAMDDINKARYYAYKALNAIVKSKDQINECGCDYALNSIDEGLHNLKMATRASTIGATRILLDRALKRILDSLDALADHEFHDSPYGNDVLVLNTAKVPKNKKFAKKPDAGLLKSKIDLSLENYKSSLNEVINSVNCLEAKDFAQKIYNHCEQELLKPNLSEGKKYYNLRTKEITAKALRQLGDCMEQAR
ncbi:MAG: hypothetical protein AAGA86_00580 [Bacteroidota bacterium]